MAQANRAGDTLMLFGSVVANQQSGIDGCDMCADLVMGAEKFDLFGTESIVAHERGADTGANLDEDILAGADGGQFLSGRTIGEHPVKEISQRHATSQRLDDIEVGS